MLKIMKDRISVLSHQTCRSLSQTEFPWICSNLFDKRTKLPVGHTKNAKNELSGIPTKIFEHKLSTGSVVRIGIFGLYEENWVKDRVVSPRIFYYLLFLILGFFTTLLKEMPPVSNNNYFEVKNFITVAKSIVREFTSQNVEIMIAMTHQQDVRLNSSLKSFRLKSLQ